MIELNEEPAMAVGQRDPTFGLSPQDRDPMAKQSVFGKETAVRPERRDQNNQQEQERRGHGPNLCDSIRSECRIEFSVYTLLV